MYRGSFDTKRSSYRVYKQGNGEEISDVIHLSKGVLCYFICSAEVATLFSRQSLYHQDRSEGFKASIGTATNILDVELGLRKTDGAAIHN